jgi:hypothetical protein
MTNLTMNQLAALLALAVSDDPQFLVEMEKLLSVERWAKVRDYGFESLDDKMKYALGLLAEQVS